LFITDEERLIRRAEKIESWFDYLDGLYGNLLSRPAETSSLSGWNADPKTKPCECRPQWQRGRLCLACDNQGWRPIADGEVGIDPYSAQVPGRISFLLVESDGARKAKGQRQMDSTILVLERNSLIRQGSELAEAGDARVFRLVSAKSPTLTKVLWGLALLLSYDGEAVRRASREALARALAHILPGRLYAAPA
jgi:hypothetical protein